MKFYSSNAIERAVTWLIGASLVAMGIALMSLGVTWLPFLGFLLGLPFAILGYYYWKATSYRQPVEIRVDSRAGESLDYAAQAGRGVISVAILSTSRAHGDSYDFDANRIVLSSVRLCPNMVKAVEGTGDTSLMNDVKTGVDEGSDTALFLHFPLRDAGVKRDSKICVTGETVDGESFYGCTLLSEAA